jgi:hypothetical protein
MLRKETLSADYINEGTLRRPSYILSRVSDGETRMYCKEGLRGEHFTWYPGVTAVNDAVVPNTGLMWWYLKHGIAQAKRYRDERCSFGSLMHRCFADVVFSGKIDYDTLPAIITAHFDIEHLRYNLLEWTEELSKDLTSFAWWVKTANVVFHAIEIPVCSDILHIATQVDFICEMDWKVKGFFGEEYKSGPRKGEPKETTKIVRALGIGDAKSKLKANKDDKDASFTSPKSNAVQLAFCDALVKENFPDLYAQYEHVVLFNWHPVNWRTEPDAHIVNQSDKIPYWKLEAYSRLYHDEHDLSQKISLSFTGTYELGGDMPLTDHYTSESWQEFAEREHDEEDAA